VLWANRLYPTTPILVLHGTADWRVYPHDALAMRRALLDPEIPFRMVTFEGGTHGDPEFADEQERREIAWFDRHHATARPCRTSRRAARGDAMGAAQVELRSCASARARHVRLMGDGR
jgi:dienelactone hydrolase